MTFVAHSRRNMLLGAASTITTAKAEAAQDSRPPADAGPSTRIHAFSTLAGAEAAAKSGAAAVGEVVMVLGYAQAGDGGGIYAAIIAEGVPGGHPHARRLRVLGGL